MANQPVSILEDLQAEADGLGFFLLGTTNLAPLEHFTNYEIWLANGFHVDMNYLARPDALEKRARPQGILPEAHSLISLGLPYPAAFFAPEKPGASFGRVAAYAWGEDYHRVIPSLLEKLITVLEKKVGRTITWRGYSDSGPLLERELAHRSGLGWIGKNSCLIHPLRGSFFLLAEIIIDFDLPPSPKLVTDHCGTCRRCIDACPTGCILPNRTVDSRRCISYNTIENRTEIPSEVQPQLGEWIFGCDVCQMVCPWNLRFALNIPTSALGIHLENAWVDLAEEIRISPDEFKYRYSTRPISRPKYTGWLRNCLIVAGNSAAEELIRPLAKVLFENPIPILRITAARSLHRLGGQQVRRYLQKAAALEPVEEIKKGIEKLLQDDSG